jgi:soluble lytic murein transglycosylase
MRRQDHARPFRFILLTALCWLLVLSQAGAQIYGKVESDGTLTFTNVPAQDGFKPIAKERPIVARRMPLHQLAPAVAQHSAQHGVDPALIWAVMKAESDFDPRATSRAGAVGLMQLMPETAVGLAVNPYDPEENIAGGTRYLRYLLDRFRGNLPLALAAYNAGATRVESYRTLPPIQETREYVSKVLRFYRSYARSLPGTVPTVRTDSRVTSSPTWVDGISLARSMDRVSR